jgi:hypothetical protein
MKQFALTMTILSISVFLIATSAQAFNANQSGGLAGYSRGIAGPCPAGTCAKNGGTQAKNIKNCAAANCSKARK